MSRRLARVRHGDDGVALVMALVFLLVVGIFMTVALEKAQSTAMTGATLRERGDLQYALDAGVERAVTLLRQDLAATTDPVLCSSPSADEQDLTAVQDGSALSLNGQQITLACRGLAGRAAKDSDDSRTNYAIVITDTSSNALTTQAAVSEDLVIDGSVFLAGDVTNSGLSKPLEIRDADVVQSSETCVLSDLQAVTRLKVQPDQYKTCTPLSVDDVMPKIVLPSAPDQAQDLRSSYIDYPLPSAQQGQGQGQGQGQAQGGPQQAECRVFFPGRYAGPPDLLSGNGKVNWFLGGVYDLDFAASEAVWSITNQQSVVVGKPTGDDEGAAVPTSCPIDLTTIATTDVAALPGAPALDTASAQRGGTFVLSGPSRIAVSGKLAMNSPEVRPGSDQAVNLVAARSGDVGYTPWSGSGTLLQNDTAQSAMVFNARVLAPQADLRVFASLPNVATLRGGVVARRLHLGASAAAEDIAVQVSGSKPDPADPYRTVLITTRDANGTSGANVAVVNISNDAPYTATTLSWRSE